MRYGLWDLGCKEKAGRCLLVPPLDCRKGRSSIIGAVNFNRVEFRRVKREALGGFHAARIERAVPSFGRKRRCTDAKLRHVSPFYILLLAESLVQRQSSLFKVLF